MQNAKQIPQSREWEQAKYEFKKSPFTDQFKLILSLRKDEKYEYKKSSNTEIFKVLQSLRKDEVFCDIKLKTDDGKIIFGHKVVLASGSPYFHAMFTHFTENNVDLVVLRQIDSTALQLLVDFIYSGKIIVTGKNIQVLLPVANRLQLQEIKGACCDFLQTQLCPTNCIGINSFANLHNCTQLLKISGLYILQHFSDVAEGDEFLSLSSDQVVELISRDELTVPSEEKVFECIIRWVRHELNFRMYAFPQLMELVRLPLSSKKYILTNVVQEPLLNIFPKCKDYIIEALQFHLSKSDEVISIPQTIRTKPRSSGGLHKVILVVGGFFIKEIGSTEWYDPKIKKWRFGPQIMTPRWSAGLAVVKDNFVFAVGGGLVSSPYHSVDMLDLSSESPCWKPTANMLVKRNRLGVGVVNNDLYAVGGHDGTSSLNSAEVLNSNTQKWRKICNMSTRRASVGVGVLKNLLYAIGGYNCVLNQRLKSVECYHTIHDKWTQVAEMCERRSGAGVGVLEDVLYAVGGHNGLVTLSSVEAYRPCTGAWTTIANMHLCRKNAGVAVLDGLLYVVGGNDGTADLDSVEFYNPITNTWTMVTASMFVARNPARVVAINWPQHFKTCWN